MPGAAGTGLVAGGAAGSAGSAAPGGARRGSEQPHAVQGAEPAAAVATARTDAGEGQSSAEAARCCQGNRSLVAPPLTLPALTVTLLFSVGYIVIAHDARQLYR